MTPKLSILLPTYNGARYLDEQMETILAQSDGDFELLAVDDGSTDGTSALLAGYAARDARLRVVASSGNRGQNARLVELLGEARGDHVAIADQDDRWAADRNERLFACLNGQPMAMARSELIDGEGKQQGRSLTEAAGVDLDTPTRLRALHQAVYSAHAMLGRREHFSTRALWSPAPFDWLMGLEALFSGGLVYVDGAVTFHRLHGANQMNRLDKAGSRWTPSHLRQAALFRPVERLRFWLALDYLGRSILLDEAMRRLFAELAGQCRTTWFSEWRALRSSAGLGEAIKAGLRSHAAGEEDWAAFSDWVDMLTVSPASGAMIREVSRRFSK